MEDVTFHTQESTTSKQHSCHLCGFKTQTILQKIVFASQKDVLFLKKEVKNKGGGIFVIICDKN